MWDSINSVDEGDLSVREIDKASGLSSIGIQAYAMFLVFPSVDGRVSLGCIHVRSSPGAGLRCCHPIV